VKRTNLQKAERVLTFLMGLRNLKALEPMVLRGLGPEDVEEGWRLLRGMASYPFELAARKAEAVTVDYVAAVDAWENHWFGIIDASLTRSFPEIRAHVFLGLRQTSGPGVLLSVGLLVQRIEALRGAGASQREREAFALLQRRGLDDAQLAEVRGLLSAAKQLPLAPPKQKPAPDPHAGEEAAWAWYLEWSAIARRAVSDRRMLRELGFLTGGQEQADASPETGDAS
jgi:hypothetical protein